MKLWDGRFSTETAKSAWDLNASIAFDQRLALQDIRGSIAWANVLNSAGVLSVSEVEKINHTLKTIAKEFKTNDFDFKETDEDIHTAVERRLGELIGDLAGKLHTGRSRNDQVATDFRLWLLDHIPILFEKLTELQVVLVKKAELDIDLIIPGYTHLQQAQPILLSHWWLSHFWSLSRDIERLLQIKERTAVMPLGSGALAGTTIDVDREDLAKELGFDFPSQNSLDAVSDRDFAVEFLFFATLTSVHLSKLAEGIILFSSQEFGFIELSDAFSTGSSLLPQKKNPDVFELARGKTGKMIGNLTGLLATLKALPSAYDKDLQEDKVPVFNAFDTLMSLLPVISGALETLSLNHEKIKASLGGNMMAVSLADYLVKKGIPFREAHKLVGEAVKIANNKELDLNELSLAEFREVSKEFDSDLSDVFDFEKAVSQSTAIGGTAPLAVQNQIVSAKKKLQEALHIK